MSGNTQKSKLMYMLFGILGTALIVASYFLPTWWVALESIQYPKAMYPKGIRIEFKYDGVYNGCEGVREREELAMDAGADCLIEMNKINHFIGMYPIVQGVNDVDELGNHVKYPVYAGESIPDEKIPANLKMLDKIMRNSLIVFIIFGLMGLFFVFNSKKKCSWAALIPSLSPFYFLAIYVYYLYWYGHNLGLHGGGAFNGIKPFMPTVFGEGKVAQFITMSYPYIGFYVGLAGFVIFLLAIKFKNSYLAKK
jgi:hypothetical protein